MKKEDKPTSIEYWNKHAEHWDKIAYDKTQSHLVFPSSQERQDITVDEIKKIAEKNASIIDIGCGDGQLVIEFHKNGFTNAVGVDNSEKMIDVARKKIKNEVKTCNPETAFLVGDADSIDTAKQVDFVTAMGIIEYVQNNDEFLSSINKLLKKGGLAYIESRNKMFNLFSSNRHTVNSQLREMVDELEDIKKYSPLNEKETEEAIAKTFIKIGEELKGFKLGQEQKKTETFQDYPFDLPQYTPSEMEAMCSKNGLKLKKIIYYHCHPFIPSYESSLPRIFNKIALNMRPLGYTYVGATMCSSFIAVVEKS